MEYPLTAIRCFFFYIFSQHKVVKVKWNITVNVLVASLGTANAGGLAPHLFRPGVLPGSPFLSPLHAGMFPWHQPHPLHAVLQQSLVSPEHLAQTAGHDRNDVSQVWQFLIRSRQSHRGNCSAVVWSKCPSLVHYHIVLITYLLTQHVYTAMIVGPGNGPPMAMNVVLVVVIRFLIY